MSVTHPAESVLPLLDKLGASISDDVVPEQVVSNWFKLFKNYCETGGVGGLISIVVEGAFWRDFLALTWDFRTFVGIPKVKQSRENKVLETQTAFLYPAAGSSSLVPPVNDFLAIPHMVRWAIPMPYHE
ncbi:hypothetical protein AX17_001502 [Amanita inopinata Kibby_2008]|nr:hypothetical protein AX17_001502 [Amanita inopinata Kibby_2008]